MDSSMKSFNPNKHMKEQFVSNLTGSSMLELFVLSAIFPMLILLRHIIGICTIDHVTDDTSSNKKDTTTVASRNRRGYISTMIVDFLSIILPFTLFCTVLADWTYINGVLCMVVLLFFAASQRHGSCWDQKEGVHSLSTYVSSYRVSMMLITCICILAVDFKIFPRRYAKTETYGTSVMDTGVGAFVFANSFVSRQARGVSTMGLRSALSSTSPLLVLGFARLVTTTGVDYQVHVGEYGVHWNFFFTLAGVAVLTSIVNVSPKYCGLVGSLVLIGYQVWLMNGLNSYLLSAERGTDIISQNKEGIYSIFGYWGLHLIGVWLGNNVLFRKNANMRTNGSARKQIWILVIFFWCLTLILDRFVERPSRRMCNVTYITLILATNLQMLGVITLSDYIPGGKLSLLEQAINRNLLAFFVVANLLTGLVNLSVNTLFVSPLTALIILIAYGFTVCAAAAFADYKGIKLKFW
ncbi:putative phosphatidylinositol anchor biosynthesis protein PIGW/GWT1 [Helianthus annuus]|nr:putative phosphatidylinositol anchor biosynthesis protein PIGW/GWT1 [Helianthus annuus]